MSTKALTAEEAVARIEDGRSDELQVPISQVMRAFGMTEDETLDELLSGRLVATGEPDGQGGYTHIAIRGDRLMAWMLLTGAQIVTVN